MRSGSSCCLTPLSVVLLACGVLVGAIAPPAQAGNIDPSFPPAITAIAPTAGPTVPSPTLDELKSNLDHLDEIAVLEAIHVGLSDAPDGATYMWRRHGGKIAGSVRPTASFRDANGKVCRFLVFQLLVGEHMRQIEGIACRQEDRSWALGD